MQLEARNLRPKILQSWIPVTCGFVGILLGSLIPTLDWIQRKKRKRSVSDIIRCTAGTIGVNYAVCRLPSFSDTQFSLSLGILGIGIWFLFDRSMHGLLCGVTVGVFGSLFVIYLVSLEVFSFKQPFIYGVPCWLPVLLYSASVLLGVVGRGLNIIPDTWYQK